MSTEAILSAALEGRYVMEREVGAGGMATVYLARDVKHNRHVALKVLNANLGAILGTDQAISMPGTARAWTLEERDRLRDDGDRYEVR